MKTIKVWHEYGHHELNITIETDGMRKTIAKGLDDVRAKEIVKEYSEKGYVLQDNLVTMLWKMSKKELVSVAENCKF